jgi:hypothetical protein
MNPMSDAKRRKRIEWSGRNRLLINQRKLNHEFKNEAILFGGMVRPSGHFPSLEEVRA